MSDLIIPPRQAEIRRETRETQIHLVLVLEGTGCTEIATPVPFLNHMLAAFGRHGQFDLEVTAMGDVDVDDHHTVEDVGLVLGQAVAQALGAKASIQRFGWAYAPMDDALARVALDLSGRAYLHWAVPMHSPTLGGIRVFHTDLIAEFFRALISQGGITAHFDLIRSQNDHHAIEAVFKAFALALRQATRLGGPPGIPSTKGVL